MTKEELLALEGKKSILRTMMSAMSLNLKKLRTDIKETEEKWEVFNKEFIKVDREIAFATKVKVVIRKKSAPMTAEQAQEMLSLLGVIEIVELDEDAEGEEDAGETDSNVE